MWTTAEVKERGKAAFQANYWPCVLAGLVLLGASGGRISFSSYRSSRMADFDRNMSTEEILALVVIILTIVAIATLVSTVMKVFITNPILFGCRKFFLENTYGGANLKDIVYAFSPSYKSVMFAGFMKDLYLFLWGLLFIVPAIVKSYSYMMVPYIIADNPDMSPNEAITRSREMMDGHKWNVFCMQLSFIGWFILSFFTLFILGVFYVNPWYFATEAELYRSLKGDDMLGRADDTFVPTHTYGNDYNYDTNSYGSTNGSSYDDPYGNSSFNGGSDGTGSTGYGSTSYGSSSYGSSSDGSGTSTGYGSSSYGSSSDGSDTSTGSGVRSSDFPSFNNDDDF